LIQPVQQNVVLLNDNPLNCICERSLKQHFGAPVESTDEFNNAAFLKRPFAQNQKHWTDIDDLYVM